jgi:hypothetical protein
MGFESLPENAKFLIIAFVLIFILLVLIKGLWGDQLRRFSLRISPKDIGLDIETQTINEFIKKNVIYSKEIDLQTKKNPSSFIKNIVSSRISSESKRVIEILLSAYLQPIQIGYLSLSQTNNTILFPSVKSISLLSRTPKIPIDIFVSFKKPIIVNFNTDYTDFQSLFITFLRLPKTPPKNDYGQASTWSAGYVKKQMEDLITHDAYSKRWNSANQILASLLTPINEIRKTVGNKSVLSLI